MNEANRTRFHQGDPGLFRTLVETHSPRLLSVALAYFDDPDVAHDVVQDSWIRAFERRRQFTGRGSLLGWLIAITRSQALSRLRRPAVRDRVPLSTQPLLQAGERADSRLDEASLRRGIMDAVFELPERQRDTVMLRIVEGRSTAESAALLGCAEGTVKASLHSALKNLAPKLKGWAP